MTYGRETEEPFDDQVPIPDAVEQRQVVGEPGDLSEDFEPTEASRIAAEEIAPVDVDPADWQDQQTSAETATEDWQGDG